MEEWSDLTYLKPTHRDFEKGSGQLPASWAAVWLRGLEGRAWQTAARMAEQREAAAWDQLALRVRAEDMQAKCRGAAVGTSLRLRPNREWEVEGLGEPVKVPHKREDAEH